VLNSTIILTSLTQNRVITGLRIKAYWQLEMTGNTQGRTLAELAAAFENRQAEMKVIQEELAKRLAKFENKKEELKTQELLIIDMKAQMKPLKEEKERKKAEEEDKLQSEILWKHSLYKRERQLRIDRNGLSKESANRPAIDQAIEESKAVVNRLEEALTKKCGNVVDRRRENVSLAQSILTELELLPKTDEIEEELAAFMSKALGMEW